MAASQIDNVIIAAPLRPGYCNETGDCSSGKRGLTTGDNYTPGVVDAVAQAVEQLRGRYHAAKVVLSERVHVRLLVGSEDTVAPPQFSKKCAEARKKRGVDVILTIAPKLEHDILLEPMASEQLKALLENVENNSAR